MRMFQLGTLEQAINRTQEFILDGAEKVGVRKNQNDTYSGGRESAQSLEDFKEDAAAAAAQSAETALRGGAKKLDVTREDDGTYSVASS